MLAESIPKQTAGIFLSWCRDSHTLVGNDCMIYAGLYRHIKPSTGCCIMLVSITVHKHCKLVQAAVAAHKRYYSFTAAFDDSALPVLYINQLECAFDDADGRGTV